MPHPDGAVVQLLQAIADAYKLPEPMRLEGDYLVAGDAHLPLYNAAWITRLLSVARKELRRPRKLIFAGDFFNLDVFSAYAQIVPAPTWQQERDAARSTIKAMLSVFDEIIMLMGNHERRLQKFTAGAFEESDLLALITTSDKVKMSPLGYCIVTSGGQVWRITHPRNYSINRLIVPGELALKYEQNIMAFHSHHLGIGWDRFGRYCIVEGGCLVDPAKLAYVSLDDNKSAVMQNGFVLLRGGVPTLFGASPITDWSKYDG